MTKRSLCHFEYRYRRGSTVYADRGCQIVFLTDVFAEILRHTALDRE